MAVTMSVTTGNGKCASRVGNRSQRMLVISGQMPTQVRKVILCRLGRGGGCTLTIVPLSDILADDRDGSLFDYLALHDSRVVVSEPEDTLAALDKLVEQAIEKVRAIENGIGDVGDFRSRGA